MFISEGSIQLQESMIELDDDYTLQKNSSQNNSNDKNSKSSHSQKYELLFYYRNLIRGKDLT